jgi:hydrogenase expression/formation protein HypE
LAISVATIVGIILIAATALAGTLTINQALSGFDADAGSRVLAMKKIFRRHGSHLRAIKYKATVRAVNATGHFCKTGDIILLNGDVGRHGMVIMSVREGLRFETSIESDCAPLTELVMTLLNQKIEIHCMRDLTRGGLASALNEIAQAAAVEIEVNEVAAPVRAEVQGACEILGLDPLYVANEGRFVAFVAPIDADRALQILRSHPLGAEAVQVGSVTSGSPGLVTITSRIGARRILDLLSGEQLPRIC